VCENAVSPPLFFPCSFVDFISGILPQAALLLLDGACAASIDAPVARLRHCAAAAVALRASEHAAAAALAAKNPRLVSADDTRAAEEEQRVRDAQWRDIVTGVLDGVHARSATVAAAINAGSVSGSGSGSGGGSESGSGNGSGHRRAASESVMAKSVAHMAQNHGSSSSSSLSSPFSDSLGGDDAAPRISTSEPPLKIELGTYMAATPSSSLAKQTDTESSSLTAASGVDTHQTDDGSIGTHVSDTAFFTAHATLAIAHTADNSSSASLPSPPLLPPSRTTNNRSDCNADASLPWLGVTDALLQRPVGASVVALGDQPCRFLVLPTALLRAACALPRSLHAPRPQAYVTDFYEHTHIDFPTLNMPCLSSDTIIHIP
jgi:hypothetical protein